jgi:hypothetical protein
VEEEASVDSIDHVLVDRLATALDAARPRTPIETASFCVGFLSEWKRRDLIASLMAERFG